MLLVKNKTIIGLKFNCYCSKKGYCNIVKNKTIIGLKLELRDTLKELTTLKIRL